MAGTNLLTNRIHRPSPVTPVEVAQSTGGRVHSDYRLDELKLQPDEKGIPDLRIGKADVDGNLDLTSNGASTVDVTILDPGKEILRGEFLTEWTWGTNADHLNDAAWIKQGRKIRMQLDDVDLRLQRLEKQSDRSLILTFEEEAVALLRDHKGPRAATRVSPAHPTAGITRAQFVKMLADEAGVPVHIPELLEQQQTLHAQGINPNTGLGATTSSVTGVTKSAAPSTSAQRTAKARKGLQSVKGLTVKGQRPTQENFNVAQTGLDVGASLKAPRNALIALVAAYIDENDMTNHPGGGGGSSGSLQLIPSTAHSLGVSPLDVRGCAQLFFTKGFSSHGGAIHLARQGHAPADIATMVQGNRDGASVYAQFVGEATRWVDAYAPGAFSGSTLVGGGATTSVTVEKRYQFTRGRNETSWDAIQRLAQEVNWRAFVRKGVLWYISDERLRQQEPALVAHEHEAGDKKPDLGIDNITFTVDLGARDLTADLQIEARATRWTALPGMVVVIEEEGPANGRWLVQEVARPLWDEGVTISCTKPTGKKPEPAADTASLTFGGSISAPVKGGHVSHGGAFVGGIYAKRSNWRGQDRGVDFAGAGAMPAFASGTITFVLGSHSGWPRHAETDGLGALIGQSLDTPVRGVSGAVYRYLYYAENITPKVHVGQRVQAGDVVAIAAGSFAYTEQGFAADSRATTYASAHGQSRNIRNGAGHDFQVWIGY